MQVRHAHVCPDQHRCAGSSGFTLFRQDTHVSALIRTDVRVALCVMWARHARVRPAPHIVAESASRHSGGTRTCPPAPPCPAHTPHDTRGKRLALCGRDTHVSAPPRTYVQEALCAIRARHASVRPALHRCARSALRRVGKTRGTCLPCPAPRYGMRSALCRRDTPVSSRPCADVLGAHRAIMMRARHVRVSPVCPALHIRAGSASRHASRTGTYPPGPADKCGKHFAICGQDTNVSALPRTYAA